MSLSILENKIKKCRACPLWKTRINAVPGEGPKNSRIMIIGEAPGRNEDEKGRPFVGLAGKRLNKLLENNNILRKNVFITNVVKCRPPKNRVPTPAEAKICIKLFLNNQIKTIKPKLIILLGKTAASNFLQFPFKEVRGKFIKQKEYIFFPVYHPSAARFTKIKEKLEEDFAKLSVTKI